jgi:hypothetical protein
MPCNESACSLAKMFRSLRQPETPRGNETSKYVCDWATMTPITMEKTMKPSTSLILRVITRLKSSKVSPWSGATLAC